MLAAALLAIAAFALMSAGGKGKTSSAPGAAPDPAVMDDLKKLYAANPTTYNAVNSVLGGGNPAVMIQYAAQLLAGYPALAKKLGDMAASEVTPITGASGTVWNLWGKESGGTATVDVLLGAMPVLSYTQQGVDKTSRKLLGFDTGVDSATLARARADFAV
jgi:hypothetical protein